MSGVTWARLASALGLAPDTPPPRIMAALAANTGRVRMVLPMASGTGPPSAPDSDRMAEAAIRAVVDEAIAAGKFPESRRSHYTAMLRDDWARGLWFIDQLAAVPELAPQNRKTAPVHSNDPALDNVARLAYEYPEGYTFVTKAGWTPPPPFPEGEQPLVTASGVDPSKLAGLPRNARIAAARAGSAAEVQAIVEAVYSGDVDDLIRGNPHVQADWGAVYDSAARPKPAPPQTAAEAEQAYRDAYPEEGA